MAGTAHEVRVFADKAELIAAAQQLVLEAAREAIAARGRFVVALSGGSTPRPLYAALAADPVIDWPRWHFFLSDERAVPPDHADSNYRMVKEVLLDRLAPPLPTVVRWQTEFPPREAATRYEEEIVRTFSRGVAPSAERSIPRFDLILLGMGADGHTASLFPATAALEEERLLAAANPVPKLGTTRLTFTLPLINHARQLLVLATGKDKHAPFLAATQGAADDRYPMLRLAPRSGMLTWLVDEAAATGR